LTRTHLINTLAPRYLLPLCLVIFTGCTTIVDATRDQPIATNAAERSLGARIDDSRLSTIIAVNINKAHPDLDSAHVKVDIFNGVVLLSGEVPTENLRTLAGDTARAVANVRQVHNELSVRPNSSVLSRMNDSYLHSRIKLRLLSEAVLNGTNIDVVVVDDTAFLMGLVSAEQAEVAGHVTSLIGGVRRVVKVFEYVE
jgi:osmotically-inducible protein OsmY